MFLITQTGGSYIQKHYREVQADVVPTERQVKGLLRLSWLQGATLLSLGSSQAPLSCWDGARFLSKGRGSSCYQGVYQHVVLGWHLGAAAACRTEH